MPSGLRRVTITRVETGDQGTYGFIREYFGSGLNFEFRTGELPNRGNQGSISDIPPGVYRCEFRKSDKFPNGTFMVMDVDGRTVIRIHIGNWCGDESKGWYSDVEGCILLGTVVDTRPCPKNGDKLQKGVFNSTVAFNSFMEKMGTDPFEVEIVEQIAA